MPARPSDSQRAVIPLDLNFMNCRNAIGVYVIKHSGGAALVESGPGSTIETLVSGLSELGLTPGDITHVLITHIHLDHAGASGWLAQQGAQVCVHPFGAPHMLRPERLLASAKRIYGDQMDHLWGEFLPVPAEKLVIVEDGGTIKVGDHELTSIFTPGHAEHHVCWLFEDFCFTGDVGGVRLPGRLFLRMPFVPPELHLRKWHLSLQKLQEIRFKFIVPTHFGIYDDTRAHLEMAVSLLVETEGWLQKMMSSEPPVEELKDQLISWLKEQARQQGVDEILLKSYEVANPSWMGAEGLLRYWRQMHSEK